MRTVEICVHMSDKRISNRINDFLAHALEIPFEDITSDLPELRFWGL